MKDFVAFTKPDYHFAWYHEMLCEKLDQFIAGKIQKLLIFAPPQHGKSELTTRRLPAKLLGHYPHKKIAIVSYNATLAEAFNRDIQRIIDDETYHRVFPKTVLNESNVVTNVKSGYLRNTVQFETVPYRGGVRTIGVDGTLTGFTVDILIFDDLYKSRDEALSSKKREAVESSWKSVLVPRLHNDSQILGTFTRWAPNDLGGMLMAKNRGWEVVSLPAIKERHTTVYHDPRKIGEVLWPERHSLERINEIKEDSPAEFNALYQQNPSAPKEMIIYNNWEEIERMPRSKPFFYGMDFGFSNDPTAIVQMELHGNNLYLNEIEYSTNMVNSDIKKTCELNSVGKQRMWADSEDLKTIRELNMLGLNVIPCKKGPGSVVRGINKCQKLKLFVTKHSHNLKRELGNYQWVAVDGKPSNTPLEDGNDHLLDAMRYGYEGYTAPKMK